MLLLTQLVNHHSKWGPSVYQSGLRNFMILYETMLFFTSQLFQVYSLWNSCKKMAQQCYRFLTQRYQSGTTTEDCRRSISAILTWVPENVKISARPLNSIGNQRVFTLLLTFQLLPLAYILLRVKCRYMSLVCINVTNIIFVVQFVFQPFFSAGRQTCLLA